MEEFFEKAAMQNHPLRVLQTFLELENITEQAKKYEDMHFVGYVLEIGYNTVTIITSDPYKIAVGGVPRNSLLIMVPASYTDFPPHFTLLRVLEAAPTPLSKEVQQTYFELQKKSMPELDIFTQSELQWGALKTGVLGMFYPHPEKMDRVEFSGDLNNFVSAIKYRVYAPDETLLELITNSMVPDENRFSIGALRLTECRLPLPGKRPPNVTVNVSTNDFMGTRTAMFGKTRLGKSNIVKLIAQSLIETTNDTRNVGQLIFDIDGEYANDNPQDESFSLKSAYPNRCVVYAITRKPSTESRPLRLNFYEHPEKSLPVIASLLTQDGRTSSTYVRAFTSVDLIPLEEIRRLQPGPQTRALRRIQMFWAILRKAGYSVDEARIRSIAPTAGSARGFNPGFNAGLRDAAYSSDGITPTPTPQQPSTLDDLVNEFEVINRFRRNNPHDANLRTASGNPMFEQDDISLLEFLEPPSGRSGTSYIQPYRMYHDHNAGDFVTLTPHHLGNMFNPSLSSRSITFFGTSVIMPCPPTSKW
jgi:hypothetical protein